MTRKDAAVVPCPDREIGPPSGFCRSGRRSIRKHIRKHFRETATIAVSPCCTTSVVRPHALVALVPWVLGQRFRDQGVRLARSIEWSDVSLKVMLPEKNDVRPNDSSLRCELHQEQNKNKKREGEMRKLTLMGWGVLMLSMASFWNLPAQEVVAHIRGTVTDPSGAAVPGAEVKATNTQTRVAATVPSKEDGSFEFLSLTPGIYDVTVTKSGFRTFTARKITLTLNQVYSLTVPMEVGQVTESVQVEANPTQVETATTQLGTIIDAKQIVDLPLNGRNWTQLQQLVPGVVASSDRFGTGGNYASNGSESQQNSFLINGADALDFRLNAPLIIPSPDAIGEFNFITSTINPEYGRNSGGILNAVIKSGTNQFHGSAFEFYRDTFLNTHNFFQSTVPVFHQNQYGGVLGGPIWKDHTFFFISYQGRRSRSPDSNSTSNTTTVFSNDQRNGFFPSIVGSTGTSATALVGENGATYAAGTPYSTLFPTGHIPTQDFNRLSQNLLTKYVPTANLGTNLFTFNPIQTVQDEQGLARIDHTFGNKDAMWVSLFFDDIPVTHALPFLGSVSYTHLR